MMNQQPAVYPPYPYPYPSHPYPTHAQQSPYTYTAPSPHQQTPAVQQSQFFRSLPQGVGHHTLQHALPSQYQRQPSTSPPSAPTAPSLQQQNGATPAAPTPGSGPGAPPAEPTSPPDEMEEELVDALRPDGQTNNEGENHHYEHSENDDENDEQDEALDAVFNLPPPAEGVYASEQELEKVIHAWSLEHGYELVRRASKKNAHGELYKRYYHCSKHGKLANTSKLTVQTRQRVNRKSNRQGCPMSLAAVAVHPANPAGQWQIRHRKTHHNHGPLDALAMAGHRRRARMGGIEKNVDALFALGTSTTQILQFLQRTNPDGLFTRTDVANMKLKYKKYGSCVNRNEQSHGRRNPSDAHVPGSSAFPSACNSCRTRKVKCDSVRPVCGTCVRMGQNVSCEYRFEPGPMPQHQIPSNGDGPASQQPRETQDATAGAHDSANEIITRQILADLHAHSATSSARPSKLSLNSSSVEVLAQSSSGDGNSYKNIPTLNVGTDWQSYSDAFFEASLKENTYDVLVGSKTEPVQPPDSAQVEEWNEYVKKLAIYNRRNTLLLGAIWGSVSPSFRTRIQGLTQAREVWMALEQMCQPRGSEKAFVAFENLCNIKLQACQDLKEYIERLEVAYGEFCKLKTIAQVPQYRQGVPMINSTPSRSIAGNGSTIAPETLTIHKGGDVFTEDALTLLFLKNLGPGYRRWVESVCLANNIAGFGTGAKLDFKAVCRRALEYGDMERRLANESLS